MTKREQVMAYLARHPDDNVLEVARQFRTHSSVVYKARKDLRKLAPSNGEPKRNTIAKLGEQLQETADLASHIHVHTARFIQRHGSPEAAIEAIREMSQVIEVIKAWKS